MPSDFRALLWLLKLGAIVNVYLIASVLALAVFNLHVVVPALVLLGVSAFRCLFPNRYLDNIVFHDSPLSSIFLTRLLATFSEVAYIYQFSYVIRVLNVEPIGWLNALSWLMVAQVVVSQAFVWSAILTKRLNLYFYEELGWLIIFAANTAASAFLYSVLDAAGPGLGLLLLNLVFGVFYLPWQVLHLRSLLAEAQAEPPPESAPCHWREGLRDAIHERNRRTDAKAWGGLIGLTWMVAYWVSLIPIWVHHIARVVSDRSS
jgi:hypothetical protein